MATNENEYSKMVKKLSNLQAIRSPFACFVLTIYEEFIIQNPDSNLEMDLLNSRCEEEWEVSENLFGINNWIFRILTMNIRSSSKISVDSTRCVMIKKSKNLWNISTRSWKIRWRRKSGIRSSASNVHREFLKKICNKIFRNAYQRFMSGGAYNRIKAENPSLKRDQIFGLVSNEWKALTKDDKQEYIDAYVADKKVYDKVC